jgi:S-disulfanyl-L-cysteine oxidoreductase SoxD
MFSFNFNKAARAEIVEVALNRFDKFMANGLFLVIAFCLLCFSAFAQAQNIGRTATPAEVKAWDIDVRPDFKGLPKGAGSVSLGEKVWEAQCASCHGTFGESNSVFFQLIGHTNKKDVEKGNVATLQLGNDAPARTMSMKLPTISTLWDYINRAMPWTAPKSLTADEVYGVTAFLMNLSNVVPDDFVLSDKNIAEVQKRLPNRNGMTTKHAMWPGKEINGVDGLKAKPDTQGSTCTKNCGSAAVVSSSIPAYAMTAHGNLAEQNRTWTSVVGLDTSKPLVEDAATTNSVAKPVSIAKPEAAKPPADAPSKPASAAIKTADVLPMLQKNACTACHAVSSKVMGPSFKDVSKKYAGRADAASYLAGKIKSGGGGVWGAIPMPPSAISASDADKLGKWLAQPSLD